MNIPNRDYQSTSDQALKLEEAGFSEDQARVLVSAFQEVREDFVNHDQLKAALKGVERRIILGTLALAPLAVLVGILAAEAIVYFIGAPS